MACSVLRNVINTSLTHALNFPCLPLFLFPADILVVSSFLSHTFALFLFLLFSVSSANHGTRRARAREGERIAGADGFHRAEQRGRINTRADTNRGRINHRKIMHVTSTEGVGNGERVRMPLLSSFRTLSVSRSNRASSSRARARVYTIGILQNCTLLVVQAIKRTRDIGLPTTATQRVHTPGAQGAPECTEGCDAHGSGRVHRI